jgi:hypothetical protein
MPLTTLWFFFPLAISLHNLEEALWLPQWSRHAKRFHKPVEANEFYFAVLIVTMLAYVSTFLALAFPTAWLWKNIFFGFLGAMILNAFVPHLAATIFLRRYAPGLLTGIFLLVPIDSIILYQSVLTGDINVLDLLVSVVIVSIALLSLIPLFFWIGRMLANQTD